MHILFLDLYFLQPFYSFFFFGAAYWMKISIDHFCACLFIQYSFVSCLFNLFAFYIQQHATDNIQKEILDRNKIQEAKIERKKKKDKKQTTIIIIRRNEAAIHSIETHWKLNLYEIWYDETGWKRKKSVQTNAFAHMSEILSFIYMHASYMYNRLNSSKMRIHVQRIYGHVRVWAVRKLSARERKRARRAKMFSN